MAIIVTYDVPSKHRELKKIRFEQGYKDRIFDSKNILIHFPNTTLYHATKTATQAREDETATCLNLQIKT